MPKSRSHHDKLEMRLMHKAVLIEMVLLQDWTALAKTLAEFGETGLRAVHLEDWEGVREILDKRVAIMRAQSE